MSGRKCEQCGHPLHRFPLMPKRTRDGEGRLICDRCSAGKRTNVGTETKVGSMVSCVHCGNSGDRLTVRAGLVVCADGCSLRAVAHDGGNNEIIYHCYAGETEYLTPDGRKTLAETVDTEQFVLTNPGNGGYWVQAHIHSFGEQQLYAVTLRRNQHTKVLFATAGHRWLVRKRLYGKTAEVARNEVALTSELRPEDRLAWLLPVTAIGTSTPSPFGVAHGIVYGDGTRAALGSVVNLWGEKDAELLRFFSESRTSPTKTAGGVEGVHIMDLPGFFKGQPDIGESVPYLYGWLAGYFAADGHVTKQGQVVLDSADLASLEFVERVCLRLGIATYGITSRNRLGFGQRRTVHRVQFVGSTLRPNFFLVSKHRERYEAAIDRGNPERLGWTVVSVEATDRVEEVFCAVVPGTETFTLADYIHTGNCPFCGSGDQVGRSDGSAECRFCKQVYTVQVQPPMPAQPQTINGEPRDWPGKPGGPLTPEQEKAGLEIQLGPETDESTLPPAVPAAGPNVPGPGNLDMAFANEILGETGEEEDPAAPKKPPFPPKKKSSITHTADAYATTKRLLPSQLRPGDSINLGGMSQGLIIKTVTPSATGVRVTFEPHPAWPDGAKDLGLDEGYPVSVNNPGRRTPVPDEVYEPVDPNAPFKAQCSACNKEVTVRNNKWVSHKWGQNPCPASGQTFGWSYQQYARERGWTGSKTASDDVDWEDAFEYAQSRGLSASDAREFANSKPNMGYASQELSRWRDEGEPLSSEGSAHPRMFLTEDGVAMPEDSFMRRLAVRFADDRAAVIEDIRASRS